MKTRISVPAIKMNESRKQEGVSREFSFESETANIEIEYSVEEFLNMLSTNKELIMEVLDMIRNFNVEKFTDLLKGIKNNIK